MKRELKCKIYVYIFIGVILIEIYPIREDYFERIEKNPDISKYEQPTQWGKHYVSSLSATMTTAVWDENFINQFQLKY